MKPLELDRVSVDVEDTRVLSDVSLTVPPGEIHWLMGPNGSGKSTLANALMGHPKYTVSDGNIRLGDTEILDQSVHERAQSGLFLSMQYPPALEGVTVTNLLKNAYNARFNTNVSVLQFRKLLKEQMQELQIPQEFASRYVHSGFSGGEKKRLELLQLGMLEPEVAILDEPDSGLDVDALKMLSDHLISIQEKTGMGVLIITHYTQLLSHIEPTGVHIIKDGYLIQSGSQELAETVQNEGYEHLTTQ